MVRDEAGRRGTPDTEGKEPDSSAVVVRLTNLIPAEVKGMGSSSLLDVARAIVETQPMASGWGAVTEDPAISARKTRLHVRMQRIEDRQKMVVTPEDTLQQLLDDGRDDEARTLIREVRNPLDRNYLLLQSARHYFSTGDEETGGQIVRGIYESTEGQEPDVRGRIYIDIASLLIDTGHEYDARIALSGGREVAKSLGEHPRNAVVASEQLVAIAKDYKRLGENLSAQDVVREAHTIAMRVGGDTALRREVDSEDRLEITRRRGEALVPIALAHVEVGNIKEAFQAVSDISSQPSDRKDAKEKVLRAIVDNPDIEHEAKVRFVITWLTPEDAILSELLDYLGRQNALESGETEGSLGKLGLAPVNDRLPVSSSLLPQTLDGKESLADMIADLKERGARYFILATEHFFAGDEEEGKRLFSKGVGANAEHYARLAGGDIRLAYHTRTEQELRVFHGIEVAEELIRAGGIDQAVRLIDVLDIRESIGEDNAAVNISLALQKSGNLEKAMGMIIEDRGGYIDILEILISKAEVTEEVKRIEQFYLEKLPEGATVESMRYSDFEDTVNIYRAIISRALELDDVDLALEYAKQAPTRSGTQHADNFTYFSNIVGKYIERGELDTAEGLLDHVSRKARAGFQLQIAIAKGNKEVIEQNLEAMWANFGLPHGIHQRGKVLREMVRIGKYQRAIELVEEHSRGRIEPEDLPALIAEVADELSKNGRFSEALAVAARVDSEKFRTPIFLKTAKGIIRKGDLQDPDLAVALEGAGITDQLGVAELIIDVAEETDK